ncbi:non-ribosomal peptide synthetase [Nocardia ignorata]|uniref:Pyochelin synthetase n=1 Tax=Nocardia ignorata TaxID=145285 RepID=A0A4R6PH93_NOCIG|nr:non-ribosomal peptide synthetase [Nocardia ignorata]TDP37668.1 pyochelin synthetase [Nocardia ignorata]
MPEFASVTLPSTIALGPIQRAYLVGDQEGLELRSPARYYLACELNTELVDGLQQRVDRLIGTHPILRTRIGADLTPTPMPEDARLTVVVRETTPQTFTTVDAEVADEFRCDTLEFDDWPQMRITVVRSDKRARLHIVYAMWLMDGVGLARFLTDLVATDHPQTPKATVAPAPPEGPRARDEKYWRAIATTLAEAADLPLRPGWRQAGRAVEHRIVRVDPEAGQALAATARAHGLTVPMIFLTVYGTLLGSMGGGRAHTITLVQPRHRCQDEGVAISNCGTTVPLQIPAAEGRDFVTLAREVQSCYLEHSLHSSLSGIDIARLTGRPADRRRLAHPFAFTAVELDSERERASGLQRDWDSVQMRVPQVLLDHQVGVDADGSILLGFDWRTDAFDDGFVGDLVAQYTRIVQRLASDDKTWTRPPQRPAFLAHDTLHRRVLHTAERMPDAIAVRDADGLLSYADLVDAAADIAHRLVSVGAEVGERVGIHMARGRGQIAAALGTLMAGCVFVPLDRGLPPGRLDRITRQASLRSVVTDADETMIDGWLMRGVTAVTVSDPPTAHANPRVQDRGSADVAYVIFTSGSTGEPKGVVIRHTAVLNTIEAVNSLIDLTPSDSVLAVSSLGFDLSIYDIFGPLLVGATVVMLSEDAARKPSAWTRSVSEHGVTVWNSAPALAGLLSEEGVALPGVRVYLLSGDWIPQQLPAALQQISADAEVISLGGATEGSIWSIYHRVTPDDRIGRSIPYGRPLPGQNILVLDDQRRPIPDWHVGDIYIAGRGVADGYLDDPDRTAAAFIDDPEYGWIYRTGDRGRRDRHGVVEFLGRLDSQVKVNGHRVELGEIESVLDTLEFVRRSAVCVGDDGGGVAAYAVISELAPPTWASQAITVLRDELPSYMVPYALVAVNEIPLTSNGKIDHQRLRAIAPTAADAADTAKPPGGGLHVQEVAACWTEVLGRAPGRDSFFESGGGSLDAIRLLSLLRTKLGYDIPFGIFVSDPTVSGLAGLCANARQATESAVWSFAPRSVDRPRGRVVFFPPVGGGVSCYSELIHSVAGDLDVRVLGFDSPLGDQPAMDEIAAACLRELAAHDSDTDVVFVGWSFGGALAVEAAHKAPYPVRRVVAIDTPVSTAARRCDDDEAALLAGFVGDVQQSGGVAVRAADVRTDQTLRRRFDVYKQNMVALREWHPPVGIPHVVELRAAEYPAEPDPRAWSRVADSPPSILLGGGHFDVFEPDNARRIQDEIESAFQ